MPHSKYGVFIAVIMLAGIRAVCCEAGLRAEHGAAVGAIRAAVSVTVCTVALDVGALAVVGVAIVSAIGHAGGIVRAIRAVGKVALLGAGLPILAGRRRAIPSLAGLACGSGRSGAL